MSTDTDEATNDLQQLDLPLPVVNLAQHVTRVVRENPKAFLLEFHLTVAHHDGRELYYLKDPDGKTVRLGVVE